VAKLPVELSVEITVKKACDFFDLPGGGEAIFDGMSDVSTYTVFRVCT
jgi:hypothetical protein